ncbi:unnamed protein product [Leuciscus chuanchicus]
MTAHSTLTTGADSMLLFTDLRSGYSQWHSVYSVHFCTFAPCGVEVPSAACRIPPPVPVPSPSCFQTCHINLRRPEPLGGQGHRRRLAVSHPAELLSQKKKQHYPELHTQLSAENKREGRKDTEREKHELSVKEIDSEKRAIRKSSHHEKFISLSQSAPSLNHVHFFRELFNAPAIPLSIIIVIMSAG